MKTPNENKPQKALSPCVPVRRLPLQGTDNTRDLGGYACPGGATRWQTFIRSDNPGALTEADVEALQRYGVTTAVDLRREDEGEQWPSRLATTPGFDVHAISINDDIYGLDYEGDSPGTMAGLYITLLDSSRPAIAKVMAVMAEAPGGVLFHCAVGKDRTGVIAMLLLKLAGVGDDDVIADYAVTEIYKSEMLDGQAGVFTQNIPDFVLRSVPASAERVLRHLAERYGTAREYLLGCELSPATLDRLLEKLVDGGC